MQDQVIMNDVLTSIKNACDIFMHGSIESATPNVNGTFKQALNDYLCMQNEVYCKMQAKPHIHNPNPQWTPLCH